MAGKWLNRETAGQTGGGALAGDEKSWPNELRRPRSSSPEAVIEIEGAARETCELGKNVGVDFDWRDEVKRRPLAWSLGALGVGLLAGFAVSGSSKRRREGHEKPGVVPSVPQAYAAQPIIGEHHSPTAPEQKAAAPAKTETRKHEPVKEHAGPDRLHQELESLRDRFVDELSNIAHQVLLPALVCKIREALVSDKRAAGTQPPAPAHD